MKKNASGPQKDAILFREKDRSIIKMDLSLPFMKKGERNEKICEELRQFIAVYYEMITRQKRIDTSTRKMHDHDVEEVILTFALRQWHEIAEDLWLPKILDTLNDLSPPMCWFGKKDNTASGEIEYGWWELDLMQT